MDVHRESTLVEQALRMALNQRQPTFGELPHHADRDGQYASFSYLQSLESSGVTVSIIRPADPHDNALMQSCIGTLKPECADHVFRSRQVARSELIAYLEGWHNRQRPLSALGYVRPEQFELRSGVDNLFLHSMGVSSKLILH